jgi:hypothetical protein
MPCSAHHPWLALRLFHVALPLAFAAPSASAQTDSATVATCPSAIERRVVLHDERGQPLQLSNDSFAEQDGELLIAGRSTATFGPTALAAMDITSQDSLIAALRTTDGRVHTFARPDFGEWEAAELVAVPLGEGRWGLFIPTFRATSSTREPEPGPLWFWRISASGAGAPERLDLPVGFRVSHRGNFAAASLAGRTVLAVPVLDAEGSGRLLLFELRGDRWNSSVLPIDRIAWVALGFDGKTSELVVVAVRPRSDGVDDENSLFFAAPDTRPLELIRAAIGGRNPIQLPSISSTRTGYLVAFQRRGAAMEFGKAWPGFAAFVEHGAVRPPRAIGDDALRVTAVSAPGADAHIVLARTAPNGENEIEIFAPRSPERPVRVRIPTAGASATRVLQSGSHVVVSHPKILGGGTHVANELLWISTRCEAPSGG